MTGRDMQGRTVLVTGAARGIGAATAERFHRRGANVALVGLEPERLEARAAALGDRAAWFEADVCDNDAVEAAVAGTVDAFGGIDVAVANAGLSFMGSLQDQPLEQWVRTIDVNLLGVYRTARAVLPHVIDRGGYILNIASLAALLHSPGMSAYTAAKAGVDALTDALRQELIGTRATAGTAYFGFIDTDITRGAFSHEATKRLMAEQPAFLRTPIPLSRAIDAIERGVDRRAARLWAPWWVGIMLPLRGLLQPLTEAAGRRTPEAIVEALQLAHPDTDHPPIDPTLGIAVRDGVPAGEETPATSPTGEREAS